MMIHYYEVKVIVRGSPNEITLAVSDSYFNNDNTIYICHMRDDGVMYIPVSNVVCIAKSDLKTKEVPDEEETGSC